MKKFTKSQMDELRDIVQYYRFEPADDFTKKNITETVNIWLKKIGSNLTVETIDYNLLNNFSIKFK